MTPKEMILLKTFGFTVFQSLYDGSAGKDLIISSGRGQSRR